MDKPSKQHAMHFPYSVTRKLLGSALVGLCLVGAGWLQPPHAQAQNEAYQAYLEEKEMAAEKERQQFIKELRQLIDAAQASGFSEEEVRAITVVREGKTVLVWEFLEQEKLREERKAAQRFTPRDRYLTVTDITQELRSRETPALDKLRERTVLTGADQK
jgi:hypothetical protein